jgi:hypothetical protein
MTGAAAGDRGGHVGLTAQVAVGCRGLAILDPAQREARFYFFIFFIMRPTCFD